MKSWPGIETAIRTRSLAVILIGLVVNLLLPRLVASAYGRAPTMLADVFYMQTVCPMLKHQLNFFWTGLRSFASPVVFRLIAPSVQR